MVAPCAIQSDSQSQADPAERDVAYCSSLVVLVLLSESLNPPPNFDVLQLATPESSKSSADVAFKQFASC